MPGAQQTGFALVNEATYDTNGVKKISGRVFIKHVDEAGKEIKALSMIKGTVGNAYTTSAADIKGYTLKTTPSNATGKYTQADIIVTYVYKENAVVNEPQIRASLATGSTFNTETKAITLTLENAVSGTYSVDNGPVKEFTNSANLVLGQGKIADSTITVNATAKALDGTSKDFTFTYNKKFNGTINEENVATKRSAIMPFMAPTSTSPLASKYGTNANGMGVKKTITIDGSLSGWDKSMLIAQGAANDDYPLSQGILYQTMNVPFFIAIDTGDKSTAIGNEGKLATGLGTLWDSGITFEQSFNKMIAVSTNGANGPYIYGGNSTGLNPVEEHKPAATGINFKYGLGILSDKVVGINGAYGRNNNRIVGDVTNDLANWVDFNTLGHKSSTMDFHYEMSIPLDKLGLTGTYMIKCVVTDSNGVSITSAKAYTLDGVSDVLNVTGTADVTNVAVGGKVTVTASASGGSGDYKYSFLVHNKDTNAWHRFSDFTNSNVLTWTAASAGNREFFVEVKDSTGKIVRSSAIGVMVGTIENPLVIAGTSSASNIKVGEKITITATASGGSGNYTYRFRVFNKDTNESYVFSDFNKSNVLSWTAASKGNRDFFVEVKDSTGKIVKSKEIQVKVTK